MALRKSVVFKEETEISMFFVSQPPNLSFEKYTEKLKDQNLQLSENNQPVPAYCNMYSFEESDEEANEESAPEMIKFITMSELDTLNSHFLLFIDSPGAAISNIISSLTSFFPSEYIETFTIVKPFKKSNCEEDFNIGYEGKK